jgi:hypothetical protein
VREYEKSANASQFVEKRNSISPLTDDTVLLTFWNSCVQWNSAKLDDTFSFIQDIAFGIFKFGVDVSVTLKKRIYSTSFLSTKSLTSTVLFSEKTALKTNVSDHVICQNLSGHLPFLESGSIKNKPGVNATICCGKGTGTEKKEVLNFVQEDSKRYLLFPAGPVCKT